VTFEARFAGTCEACDGRIKVGDVLTYRNQHDGPVHAACPDAVPSMFDAPVKTPLCQRCFTYHNGECL
jgi:hypothetical protein